MDFEEFRSRFRDPVHETLIGVARERRRVGYKELLEMPEVGLPKEQLKMDVWLRHLPRVLDEINILEHKVKRPLLSAVVVKQRRPRLPGNGFFYSLTVGPLVRTGATEEEKRAVHEKELQKVYEAWAE